LRSWTIAKIYSSQKEGVMTHSRYILRESVVSALINAAISAGFFAAFFAGIPSIPVWGVGNYAFDFVPQTFAVALMSALVPCLLARTGKTKAAVAPSFRSSSVPEIVIRALSWAVAAVLVAAGATAIALHLSGLVEIEAGPAFAFKLIYGAVLGGIVTSRALRTELTQPVEALANSIHEDQT
jgi:hypothetical protein